MFRLTEIDAGYVAPITGARIENAGFPAAFFPVKRVAPITGGAD